MAEGRQDDRQSYGLPATEEDDDDVAYDYLSILIYTHSILHNTQQSSRRTASAEIETTSADLL